MGNKDTYDLNDFQDIINQGFVCSLPEDTINIISLLAEEVGAPTYVKTPVFEKREMHKKKKGATQSVSDSEWESIRQFKATELNKKEGISKRIDEIRGIVNKMSFDNFGTKKLELFELIDGILQEEEADDNIQRAGATLFGMVSRNKFYSELYAGLYKDLMEKYAIFADIFKSNFEEFLALFDDIKYVSPDDDYDTYCDNNKTNEERKALSMFFVNLMKNDIISQYDMIIIIEKLQSRINEYINMYDSVNKVEEVTDNLFIIVSNIKDELKSSAACTNVLQKIQSVADYSVKEKPSLSNKVVFKHMDLIDILE
ncbi:MAG: hypothetical protein ACXABD_00035 [Candidatus Thorarchaeota archaeon]|jgi:hypothetical protein